MKTWRSILLLIVLTGSMWLVNIASACCSTVNGTVTAISVLPGGQFFFGLSGSESGKPACNTTNRYVVDTNTQGGRSTMSVVLSAYLSGKTLTVLGFQTCTIWSDSEDMGSLTSP